jgi:hypothetical protein
MSSMFSGHEPNAQKQTLAMRQAFLAGLQGFMKAFASSVPAATSPCIAWGSDSDDQILAADLFSGGHKTTDSEALGEYGAIYYLQKALAQQGFAYDDNNLRVFSGNGCFNIVYFVPSLKNPQHAIIIEAKGGNSGIGSCKASKASNKKVYQGTKPYAKVIIAKMLACTTNPDRQATGQALTKLMNQTPPLIAYVGVRTAYDKTAQEVHDPVPIFYDTV